MKSLRTISIVFAIIIFLTGCSSEDWDSPTAETNDPYIVSVIPPNGAGGVGTGDNIIAFFNKDLDPSTVTMGNFAVYNYDHYVAATRGSVTNDVTVYGPFPSKVPGAYSYDAGKKAAVFSPRYLNANTPYIAILTTGIKDSSGRNMLKGYNWTFTTSIQSISFMP